ncbi:MAG: tetratricopeptide repeat protein [Candidatus Hinthialibacter antarcticus]|nr:tetratricopeptide repeat protein [Candidatus Hinthialibacter antarcticus]
MMRSFVWLALACVFITGCIAPEESQREVANQQIENPTTTPITAPTLTATPTPQPTVTPAPQITYDDRRKLYEALLEAAMLEEKNKFAEAGEAYSKARELQPKSDYLGARAGEALLKSGKVDEAIHVAEARLLESPDDLDLHRVLALSYAEKKDWARSIEHYQIILQDSPRDLEALFELSNVYERARRFDDSAKLYHQLIEFDPARELEYRYRAALLYSRVRRFPDALTEYNRIAELLPDYYDAHVKIGELNSLIGNADAAIEAFLNALNLVDGANEELRIRRLLGLLYFQRESWREASFQYKRIKELDADDLDASRNLALIAVKMGDTDAAVEQTEAAVKQKPADYRLNRLQLEILQTADRNEEAYQRFLSGFERALAQANERNVNSFLLDLIHRNSFKTLETHGLLPRLYEILNQAAASNPEPVRLVFSQAAVANYLGYDNELRGYLSSLIKQLRQATIAENETRVLLLLEQFQYRSYLRHALLRLNLSSDLLSAMMSATLAFPNQPSVWRGLGLAHSDREEWSEAGQAYLKALPLLDISSSQHRQASFQLAYVYDKQDRLGDVETVMRELIERFPGDPEAYNYLGYTFADRSLKVEEGLGLIEKALHIQPNNGNYIDSLGWAYFRLEKYDEAIDQLERAAKIEEDHPIILDHLGDAYAKKGMTEKALQAWRQALDAGPDYPFEFTPDFQQALLDKIHRLE